ncbi:leucine-rich repeat serine/threonine-protein kinase 1, partial [Plakobranchus ocellatus]
MGTEQETAGKVQLLRNMVEGSELPFPMLSKIEDHISLMESDPSLMNLQGQQLYGQLIWQKECLNRLIANIKSRVKVMALDTTSGKGKEELINRIVQVCESDLAAHPHLYNLQESIAAGLVKLTAQVKAEKMVASSDLKIKEFVRNTRVYEQAVRFLQTKGKLIWVPMKRTVIALDIEFAKTLVKMSSSLPSTLSIKMAPCIGSETKVWNSIDEIVPEMKKLDTRKWELLNYVLLVMGVIEVPRVRVKQEDPQFCYCTPCSFGPLPVKLSDFQSKDTDVVLISREYMFLYTCATYIMSMVISRCLLVSRPVALSKDWAVFQNGAAQTLIYIHNGCNLRVETRCFMPSKQSDRLDFDTLFHVEEYSFNVFCIFIDMIDLIITRLRLKVTYTQNVPRNLVNTSIGCIHDWGLSDEEFRQTLCTLCNQCCNKGRNCPYNGVGGAYKHQCGCNTLVTGCRDCGICQGCAELLWTIRSYLRPNLEVASYGQMQSNGMVPLDATTYDELEITNLGMQQVPICLTANTFSSESKGVITKMFPSMATEFPNLETLQEHMDKMQPAKNEEEKLMRFGQGDTVTIKLDPIKRDSKTVVVVEDDTPLEISPVYFTSICRECAVWHDTGIVAYNTVSTAVPVGQFISALPLTKECPSFSFEITNIGEHGYIAIGVCPKRYPPDRQPGWNSGSIGYHADDGGIFASAGWPVQRKESCTTGDIMECRLNFQDQTVGFLKNGNEVYVSKRQRTFATLHAAVGFHSVGEAVRLLQKEPWRMAEDQEPVLPSAFDAYKYGNMHISPGRTLTLKKVGQVLRSWLMIHNPSKSKVGYKLIPTDIVSDPIGFLEPSGVKAFGLSLQPEAVGSKVDVHWFLLESTRNYTDEDLKDVYNHTTTESLLKHRIKVKVTDVQSTDSRPLKLSSDEPASTDSYLAEVFKNGVLVASYWLKEGSYVCSLPLKCDVLVRYPKFPTLDQPNGFQKGMRVIVDLTKTQKELYAEAIIEEATPDGYLRLEYSQAGENTNACMEARITSPEISIKEIEYEETERAAPAEGPSKDNSDTTDNPARGDKAPGTDKKIEKVAVLNLLSFQSRGHISVTKRAYMYPPFHLLTEASRAAISSIDESWKANTLSSIALCKNVPTRLTVQEFQICQMLSSNLDWLMGSGRGSKISHDMAFAFMPSDLGVKQLCYPNVSDMFTKVDVHFLCFYMLDMAQQLRPLTDDDELSLDVPLHFVDLAPSKMSDQSLTPETMYACSFNGWIYSTLYSNRLCLPSYENIFCGKDIQQFKRPEVEHMMGNLVHMYAAQCHIFAEQYGGLQFQTTPEDRTIAVIKATQPTAEDYGVHSYCGAHKWCLGLDARLKDQSAFRKEVFSPYEDTIHVFDQEFPNMPSLPSDFFQFFKNLQFVNLQGCHKLKQFPDGMSGCERLKMLSVKNSGLESLPTDLFLAPRLCRLHCSGLPVKSLPTSIAEHCQVTELILSWMLLSSVPKELGLLTQMKYLDLSGNPLVTLPMEMSGLTRLKTLLLSGIPWLVTEGHANGVSVEEYEQFLKANPSLTHIIGKEKLVSMFHECDHNKNQRLDGTEATALNLHIFWQVPRLGSSCISDTEYGGIPPVVFLMSSLETLHLNYQALTAVPVHMCRLQNLRELSVSNNPLLESVPGALGHLPNLKSLRLTSNPSLRTPPHEVVSRGFASIKAYLKRLAGGFTECRRTKLMLVGLGGAGKTSLLRALMSSDKKTAGTKGEDITNGIDILPWTIKSQDGIEVTYNTWDFAGQTLYYNTHQFFLSKRAVYLLLWSTRQGFEHAGLEFWLSSIASHAPKTPIFVVGTHCDQVPKADIPTTDLQERFKQIAGFHFVSSIEGKGIKELEQDLLRVTLQQKNMGEKVPKVWLNMEKKILAARQNNSILPWKTIQEFGMEVGIYDEKDIREAVQFLHELGTVQYFDNEFLRKQVVINPQWIVDVMSCVVSVKNSPIQDHKGRFLHKYIPEIWAAYPKELHEWLLRLTEEFDLTFPLPEDKVNIVPCLLPQEMPKELNWPAPDLTKNVKETKLIYKFTYLPAGLFNRAQVRLFQLSDGRLIWKRGSLLKKNKHKALISQTSDFELQVKVQGPRPENVIFLIHEIFESLIKESFHGVVYEFLVPCPDCILKEGTLDPSMFEGSLVMRARELKAPFLQCRKYFHTISMAQFYEVMPSDGTSDFDAHLQKSLITMQQLTSDLSTDLAIIYSSLDMSDDNDSHRVNPEQIKRDLEAGGLTCWFSNAMGETPIDEIMLALKNCKVVVALVSDNFESDTNSHDLLLYTLDTLNKDFVIIVIGDSMDWQNTDLGMRIGKHEEMVMVKNKSRYNQERITGMLTVVNAKLVHNQPQ